MPRSKGPRKLLDAVAHLYPDLKEPDDLIRSGHVLVDSRVVLNPSSNVGPGSRILIDTLAPLRGEAKLRAALDAFEVVIDGRVALDAGAAAGGFSKVLLERGARKVYSVDVGHGQLLGSLRQDARIVNLEATNVADLNPDVVTDMVEVITLDLSYLSLSDAVPQLERITLSAGADLIALVKPMFELHLSKPPDDRKRLEEALARASGGIRKAGWRVVTSIESPVLGSRGAVEFLTHAKRGKKSTQPFRQPLM